MITFQNAVFALVPNAQMVHNESKIVDWHDTRKQPTEKAIQAKLKELEDEYEKQAYARSRADAYDPIPEQLDQIYHDIDGWKAKVKAVKDKFPKPSE